MHFETFGVGISESRCDAGDVSGHRTDHPYAGAPDHEPADLLPRFGHALRLLAVGDVVPAGISAISSTRE